MPRSFTSGYVTIIGRPNVGKSTFMNHIMEMKLSITTPKPQTTRDRILGIWNAPDAQVVFLDTPGIHSSDKALNRYMLDKAVSTIADADLAIVMADHLDTAETLSEVMAFIRRERKEAILVLNKTDLMDAPAVGKKLQELSAVFEFSHMCGISSTAGTGIPGLMEEIKKRLPEGPRYFPEDMITDVNMRFLCKELIREKVFTLMRKEIPYSAAVEIEEYREEEPVYIRAVIHVERDSQKGIIIGAKGRQLKEIGTQARQEIERLVGGKVFLELFVKVTRDWSKDPKSLKELGYK
jgi:GTP-binding protein Era